MWRPVDLGQVVMRCYVQEAESVSERVRINSFRCQVHALRTELAKEREGVSSSIAQEKDTLVAELEAERDSRTVRARESMARAHHTEHLDKLIPVTWCRKLYCTGIHTPCPVTR